MQVFINAQTPFEIIRKNIVSSNHQNSLSIIDSCLKVQYQIDSSMYYKGLVYLKIIILNSLQNNVSLFIKISGFLRSSLFKWTN